MPKKELSKIEDYLNDFTPWKEFYRYEKKYFFSINDEPEYEGDLKWDLIEYYIPGYLLCRELYNDAPFIEALKKERNALSEDNLAPEKVEFNTYCYNRQVMTNVDDYLTYLLKKLKTRFFFYEETPYPLGISESTIKESFKLWYSEFSKPLVIKYEIILNEEYQNFTPFPPKQFEEFLDSLQKDCRGYKKRISWYGYFSNRNILPSEALFIEQYNLYVGYILWLKEYGHPLGSEKIYYEERLLSMQLDQDRFLALPLQDRTRPSHGKEKFEHRKKTVNVILKRLEEINLLAGILPEPVGGSIQTFKDIFINKSEYDKAIAALQTIKVIDNNRVNLIGASLKGVVQLWVSLLRTKKLLKTIKDQELTTLVNKEFTGLDLSEKSDGKHFRNKINKTATEKYSKVLIAAM